MNNNYPPTFIVGCGRSGTTLLRAMLNSHSKTAIPPESLFIADYLRAEDNVDLNLIKKMILKEEELRNWGINIDIEDLENTNSVKEIIEKLHNIYLIQKNKQYWIQKTPRFVRYYELLKRTYTNSRFIVVIRDPRAVVNSLKKSEVHRSNAYFGAKRWKNDVVKGVELKQKYVDDVLEVKYEDLVRTPKDSLERICDFLDIKFEEQMLHYYKKTHFDFGGYHQKIHKNIHKPLDKDRIDAWKTELNNKEINLIEDITGDLARKFGYKIEIKGNSFADLKYKYMFGRMLGLILQVRQYVSKRRRHMLFSIYRKIKLGLLTRDIFQINY